MTKHNHYLLITVAIILLAGCKQTKPTEKRLPSVIESSNYIGEPTGITKQILEAEWVTTKVSDDILYRYHHFTDLFDSRQSITIIDVDLNKKVKVDIPHVTSGFLKTSEAAIKEKATAAINGSYFDTSIGGSTVFFKKDGEVINATRDNFTHYRENAGFAIGASGSVSIIDKPVSGWNAVTASSLLTSGPLLVLDGKIVDQLDQKFNTNRHPRTAIGITSNNHLLAVVVDGRSAEAQGMSTEELATLMNVLGCKDAMNLDGGGSSTAWINTHGIVNYPSDNKKFDHQGERGVATVITFNSK